MVVGAGVVVVVLPGGLLVREAAVVVDEEMVTASQVPMGIGSTLQSQEHVHFCSSLGGGVGGGLRHTLTGVPLQAACWPSRRALNLLGVFVSWLQLLGSQKAALAAAPSEGKGSLVEQDSSSSVGAVMPSASANPL